MKILDTAGIYQKKNTYFKKNDIITLVTSCQCLLFKFIPHKSLLCKFLCCNKKADVQMYFAHKTHGEGGTLLNFFYSRYVPLFNS